MKVLRAATAAAVMVACPSFADTPDLGSVPQDEVLSLLHSQALCIPYDGQTDDLLTAGLGKTGLADVAPGFADPANPTAAELRRLAIYNNYRALVDIKKEGGYGVLYGPNVQPDGTVTSEEGKIAGVECLTYADNGSGRKNVTLMVQIPASFDPQNACIITGPSSGSRGIYGSIATSGEWGRKHGCAVAYTDKGTGNGVHDLQNDTVNLIDGQRESADFAGKKSNFTAPISDAERAVFNAATPNRFAFKHAHSRQNPEADWDVNVLQSIVFAFIELNRRYQPHVIRPGNTIVVGSSVSNGGGVSVRAAEIDRWGLIDGVAVSEPNVNPPPGSPFAIVQVGQPPYRRGGKTLYDYVTQLNIFQGCANLAQLTAAPLNITPAVFGEARCASLHAKGLLKSATLPDQAAEAQAVLNRYGFLVEQNVVQPSHWAFFVPQAVAVTYANAYARAGGQQRHPADRRGQRHQQRLARRTQAEHGVAVALDQRRRPEPRRRALPARSMQFLARN